MRRCTCNKLKKKSVRFLTVRRALIHLCVCVVCVFLTTYKKERQKEEDFLSWKATDGLFFSTIFLYFYEEYKMDLLSISFFGVSFYFVLVTLFKNFCATDKYKCK